MSKFEEYSDKAAASLAASETATNDRDRAFHRNAHTIWRKLIRGLAETEERVATQPAAPKRTAAKTARPKAMTPTLR